MRPSTLQRQIRAFVACGALLCVAVPAAAESPIGSGWEMQCFDHANAVASFAQDSTGVLWVGTQSGIIGLDGSPNLINRGSASLTPSLGLRLAIGLDDTLWVTTGLGFLRPSIDGKRIEISEHGNPGAVRITEDKVTRMGTGDGLPSTHVWTMHTGPDGTIWAGTENGVARFQNGRFVVPIPSQELPSPIALVLASDARNQLWVGTTAGLARFSGNRIDVTLEGKGVTALAVDEKRSTIWAATLSGIVGLHDMEPRRTLTVADGLPANLASALLVDHLGNLWAGTARGLARFAPDGSPPEIFKNAQGLPDKHIHSLFEDREGGIWVGTRVGGFCRITRKTAWDLGPDNGLEAETAYSIVRARDGTMWVSTGGQISRFRDGRIENRWRPALVNGAELRALTEAPDGSIWISTTGAMLVRIEIDAATQEAIVVPLPQKEFPNGAGSILFDGRGLLWLGRTGGGLLRAQPTGDLAHPGAWQVIGSEQGACPGEVTAGMKARDQRTLWFATDGNGATRWDGTHGQCLTTRDGLTKNVTTSFFEDPENGDVWIGMRDDAGLARYRNGKLSYVRGNQGLYCDSIAGLTPDAEHNLWTLCGGGVGRTRLADLNAVADGRLPFAMTLAFSSPRSRETTVGTNAAGAMDPSGRFWWATLGGVSVIEPPIANPETVVRIPKINRIEVGGAPVSIAGPVLARQVDPNLLFQFSTASFLPSQRTVYRHRLDGIDHDWVNHFEREARYTRLPTGTYRLHVGVSDGFGGWSPRELTLDLEVKPPFHRTITFWLLVVLAAVLLGLGVFKLRERTLRLRYATIAAERTRIARDLHDVIGQAFASIGLLLDAIRTTKAAMPEPTREIAERARAVLDHCHGDIRTAIWELRQPSGTETSLATLATQVIEETRRSMDGTGRSIQWQARPGHGLVPELVRHELPHVLREALSNAIKHSGADTIAVTLDENSTGVSLTVEDDGNGFAINEQAVVAGGHFGILGMRERARRMAGQLSFEARPGGGTVLRLHIPIDNLNPSDQTP